MYMSGVDFEMLDTSMKIQHPEYIKGNVGNSYWNNLRSIN